ncbi:hypothetical protein E1A91_A07G119700v1 [Gossypium mustelinum]|uniref:Uncharacterized protein n=1 Tax=Gossypium mustelinum TaxID=34275 RepID=A0A5D2YKA4_GOSMU|nr:hypothetical protein E1A91_A07G119700v1 [Gossypium mustelinum]
MRTSTAPKLAFISAMASTGPRDPCAFGSEEQTPIGSTPNDWCV